MRYLTVKNVELVSVGMEWPSANGPITFTFEHLADAMTAANEDPHIVPPRLKLGHADPRFEDPDDPGHDPFYDGEPAVGSVHNLRLVNDGATLIGDYVEVPEWLVEAMPSAYPSRSIEGAWAAAEGAAGEPLGTWDVVTPGGKKYSFVLTACALLGLSRPAVQDLDDLQRFLVAGDGLVVAGAAPEGGVPAASMGSVKQAALENVPAEARADVEKVIDSFYADFAPEPGDPRYWWWVRSVWTDPNELIVDDDEGSLYAVSFNSDDDQAVTFGDPTKVIQTFQPAPAAAAAMATTLHAGAPVCSFEAAADSRPAERVQGGSAGSAALRGMKLSARDKALLALGAEASEEEIEAALDGIEEEAPEEEVEETPAEETPETPAEEEVEETPETTPPVASADGQTVTLDRGVYERDQATLARLAKAEDKRIEQHRKGVIDLAIEDGKIMPSSRAAWEAKMATEPEATEAEIAQLEAGLVPVTEGGHSRQAAEAASVQDLADVATAQMFPNLVSTEA